jgi:hypothetical protein
LTCVPVDPTLIAMNGPPVWLLDIDGVVNAVSAEPPDVWPADCWVRAGAACTGVDWPLLAARPVLDFVRRVHRTGRAEIRWHSTWQHEAAAVADALGLPDFAVQPSPEFHARRGQRVGGAAPVGATWWKLGAAERLVDGGRTLVWTDDDADVQLGRLAEHRLRGMSTTLILAPRTDVGLTPADLCAIDAFLGLAAAPVPQAVAAR